MKAIAYTLIRYLDSDGYIQQFETCLFDSPITKKDAAEFLVNEGEEFSKITGIEYIYG